MFEPNHICFRTEPNSFGTEFNLFQKPNQNKISIVHIPSITSVTLAGHSRAIKLQAGSADPPVSARQGASVPIKLLTVVEDSSFLCLSARLAH